MTSPCLGCKNRTVGCHGSCETYRSWCKKILRKKDLSKKNGVHNSGLFIRPSTSMLERTRRKENE